MWNERRREALYVKPNFFGYNSINCLLIRFRFQDVEDDSTVELESTEETTREQNNNSMFQQNLENHQENVMVNSRWRLCFLFLWNDYITWFKTLISYKVLNISAFYHTYLIELKLFVFKTYKRNKGTLNLRFLKTAIN